MAFKTEFDNHRRMPALQLVVQPDFSGHVAHATPEVQTLLLGLLLAHGRARRVLPLARPPMGDKFQRLHVSSLASSMVSRRR